MGKMTSMDERVKVFEANQAILIAQYSKMDEVDGNFEDIRVVLKNILATQSLQTERLDLMQSQLDRLHGDVDAMSSNG